MSISKTVWGFALVCASARGGPVDFGVAEFNAAAAGRNLKWKVKYELTIDPPETYRIEPYKYGGAHVTGGDLRGLMYGLLDAAEQLRTTGHIKQTKGAPVIPIRGIRMFIRAADLDGFDWLTYFNTLARDRFNRFTLVFLDSPFSDTSKLSAISEKAAEFGIDFTLGVWEHTPPPSGASVRESLYAILASCPLIRTVQVRSDSTDFDFYREAYVKPLHALGRRVALQPLGSLADPAFLKTVTDGGVALYFEPGGWPPGFQVDLPEFKSHALLYWMWGFLGYDPQARLASLGAAGSPQELGTAARVIALLAQSEVADPDAYANPAGAFLPLAVSDPNDWLATIPEAAQNRLGHVASAKRTPLDLADALLETAAPLDRSSLPDVQWLARWARYEAHNLRARNSLELFELTHDPEQLNRAEKDFKSALSYSDLAEARVGLDRVDADRKKNESSAIQEIPPLPKTPAPAVITHVPVKTARAGEPVPVSLQLGSLKEVRAVRLHYRSAASGAGSSETIERPAAASITFSIPPANGDLIYFFEILTREAGWFEPDAFTKTPYYLIRIETSK